jgi:hypothetical protein
MLSANHKMTTVILDFRTIEVSRGQFLTSQVKLAKKWGWHRETVYKFLKLLEHEKMLGMETSTKTSSGYTLITIENYEKFQGSDGDETDSQADSHVLKSAPNLDSQTGSARTNESGDLSTKYGAGHLPQPTAKPAAARQPSGTNNNGKNKDIYASDFEIAWELYPKRAGNNPKRSACTAFSATVRRGGHPMEMIAGTRRFADYIRATRKEKTEYVMQAKKFFGPDEHWREEWNLPVDHTDAHANGGFVG